MLYYIIYIYIVHRWTHHEWRSISASSWIEINKLSRKMNHWQKISTQWTMDGLCNFSINIYIVYNWVELLRDLKFFIIIWSLLFFRQLGNVYSALTPNNILCEVIKIIVIAAACFNNMATAFEVMSFGLYHSICCCCCCCCCHYYDYYYFSLSCSLSLSH